MLDFAKDKSLWKRVREDDSYSIHRKEIRELYEHAFERQPRAHSVEEILSQNNSDNVWLYQLNQLQSSALMSLIYPDNKEYFNNLLRIIWAYCDDYTWAPLGHYNGYYNRTPADYDIGLIDIFASSIAFSLAEIKNLLEDRLPQLIKDRISAELKRRTIEPFLTRNYFWEKHSNNWAAVCAGGVGGVLMYECPDVFMAQRERLDSIMQVYLDSYADDGVCVEGVGYWGFGFGFFVSYALLEKELTSNEVDWFKNKKVKEIAMFMQKMFLQRNVLVSFSDCTTDTKYWFGLPHVLRSIYGDDIEKFPVESGGVADYTHLNFSLRSTIYFNPDYLLEGNSLGDATYNMLESAYFVKRTKNYGFATKGGNNGESHNHNDVGSFILARNNKQILCDIGSGPYEDGYHSEKRYTFFNPSSFSHNLPFFDGIGQDGVRRENVYIDYNEENSTVYMDFTNGYGIEYLKRAERLFTLLDDKITMRDSFTLTRDSDITERLISLEKPTLCGKCVTIDDVTIVCEDGIIPKITTKTLRHHKVDEYYDVYLIDYTLPKGKNDFEITISF